MSFARRHRPKVFCVGANKTGTTTVRSVLEQLGYSLGDQARGERLLPEWNRRDFGSIARYCRSATAFQDVPFSLPYTFIALDQRFRASKFILTVRDTPEQWFTSITRFHSGLWADGVRTPSAEELQRSRYRYRGFAYQYMKYAFGTSDDDLYNADVLKDVYRRHIESVQDYFRSKPDQLITINVARTEDYARLCEFLGVSSGEQDFPWENRTK